MELYGSITVRVLGDGGGTCLSIVWGTEADLRGDNTIGGCKNDPVG